jgi:DNA-binding response OmpR family regulator
MPLRCLIVDDSPEFLSSATRLLESQGMTVAGCASSSAEALELMQTLHPDVVLVDVELGPESGFDLAHQLRMQSSDVGIILISSHDGTVLEELVVGGPAVGFLPKGELAVTAISDLLAGA